MNGSPRLNDEERQELLRDGQDLQRGKAFRDLKVRAHRGTLDEYIEFLSENLESFHLPLFPKKSDHFKI
jgi:hypothetical protein